MWRPDNWPKNPCDECREKVNDAFGLVCTWTCEENIAWMSREDGADEILEALEPLIGRVAPNSKLVDIIYGKEGDNEGD